MNEIIIDNNKVNFKKLINNFDNFTPEEIKNFILHAQKNNQKIQPRFKKKLEEERLLRISGYPDYMYLKAYAEYYKIKIEEVSEHNQNSYDYINCTNSECKPPCEGSCQKINKLTETLMRETPCPWSKVVLF